MFDSVKDNADPAFKSIVLSLIYVAFKNIFMLRILACFKQSIIAGIVILMKSRRDVPLVKPDGPQQETADHFPASFSSPSWRQALSKAAVSRS